MRTSLITAMLFAATLLGLPLALTGNAGQADVPALRVGVYDNRSIAIAYAASAYNPVGQKMKAYEAAKAAGDTELVEELEAWGEKAQRQLHRQGFGRVPVGELLAHVKDRLPEVARRAGVDAIVWQADYLTPHVEKVDVTMELVQLFEPSEKTLTWAKQIREQPFVDLDELDHDH
ncbi:MAG: hypothetical protein ACYTJ0_04150 [Planctomycetota bacterium]|jgi:hypothetical protein